MFIGFSPLSIRTDILVNLIGVLQDFRIQRVRKTIRLIKSFLRNSDLVANNLFVVFRDFGPKHWNFKNKCSSYGHPDCDQGELIAGFIASFLD